jgi:hypothetical protein
MRLTYRLVIGPDNRTSGSHDFTVQAMLAFFAVTTVTKFSSDGGSFNACYKAIAACSLVEPAYEKIKTG